MTSLELLRQWRGGRQSSSSITTTSHRPRSWRLSIIPSTSAAVSSAICFRGTEPRDRGEDLDAIPAVRERNIGQVKPGKPLCNGLSRPKTRGFLTSFTSFDANPPALSGHSFRVLARDLKPGSLRSAPAVGLWGVKRFASSV